MKSVTYENLKISSLFVVCMILSNSEKVESLYHSNSLIHVLNISPSGITWDVIQSDDNTTSGNYTWRPTASEINASKMEIKYSTSTDKYLRSVANEVLRGWDNGVHHMGSFMRVVEPKSKLTYLTTKGNADGTIAWKFDLSGFTLQDMKISFSKPKENCTGIWPIIPTCFPSIWFLNHKRMNSFEFERSQREDIENSTRGSDENIDEESGAYVLKFKAFRGIHKLLVTLNTILEAEAEWQKVQLFPQNVEDDKFPFSVSITFGKCDDS